MVWNSSGGEGRPRKWDTPDAQLPPITLPERERETGLHTIAPPSCVQINTPEQNVKLLCIHTSRGGEKNERFPLFLGPHMSTIFLLCVFWPGAPLLINGGRGKGTPRGALPVHQIAFSPVRQVGRHLSNKPLSPARHESGGERSRGSGPPKLPAQNHPQRSSFGRELRCPLLLPAEAPSTPFLCCVSPIFPCAEHQCCVLSKAKLHQGR